TYARQCLRAVIVRTAAHAGGHRGQALRPIVVRTAGTPRTQRTPRPAPSLAAGLDGVRASAHAKSNNQDQPPIGSHGEAFPPFSGATTGAPSFAAGLAGCCNGSSVGVQPVLRISQPPPSAR